MALKLRKEVVFPQKLSSEPWMVEEGKGKRRERVPEQDLRSAGRVNSRRNRVKGKSVRQAYGGNQGGTAMISSFEHTLRGCF